MSPVLKGRPIEQAITAISSIVILVNVLKFMFL